MRACATMVRARLTGLRLLCTGALLERSSAPQSMMHATALSQKRPESMLRHKYVRRCTSLKVTVDNYRTLASLEELSDRLQLLQR